jgi:hypothetical protein
MTKYGGSASRPRTHHGGAYLERAAYPPPTEGAVPGAPSRSRVVSGHFREGVSPRNRRAPLSAQEPVLRRLACGSEQARLRAFRATRTTSKIIAWEPRSVAEPMPDIPMQARETVEVGRTRPTIAGEITVAKQRLCDHSRGRKPANSSLAGRLGIFVCL